MINTRELCRTLTTLFSELADGPSEQAPHMLNRGDVGLLRSLDKLTAEQASAAAAGESSIASHVDHLRYGLSLLNRWAAGDSFFDTADWAGSWRQPSVSDEEWIEARRELRAEVTGWTKVLETPREVERVELDDMVGIAHFAYPIGAIRQMDGATRSSGPLDCLL